MTMTPPKHLQALYAHAVNWCSAHDIPLSWIRAWGRQPGIDSEMPIVWDQEGWGLVFTRALPPRHPLHQSPDSVQARVWISASESEFIERGLGQYRKDWDLNSGEQWSALVLAAARIEGDHQWELLAGVGNFKFWRCSMCRKERWGQWGGRSPDNSEGPCKFLIEPLLDIQPITMTRWEFFFSG